MFTLRTRPRETSKAYICNLSPFEFFVSRSYGQFHILPAAEKAGQPYAITIIEDRQDRMDMGEGKYTPALVEAIDIAEDLVKHGGFAVHGVFLCAGTRPTQKEIDAALALRDAYYAECIKEADKVWAQFHRHEMIDDNARRACMVLGEEREWAYKVKKRINCPGCGKSLLDTVAKCSECGVIVNVDRAEQYGLIDKAKAKELRALRGEVKGKRKPEVVAEAEVAEEGDGGFADGADDSLDPEEAALAAAGPGTASKGGKK